MKNATSKQNNDYIVNTKDCSTKNYIRTKKHNIVLGKLTMDENNVILVEIKKSKSNKTETITINEYIRLLIDASEEFQRTNK